jgi:hypothetical protein
MQKYRADKSRKQSDGATLWYAMWMGGPSLSRIDNCQLENLQGDMRRTVYILGEADTFFSIPAACVLAGKRINGYVTQDTESGCLVFRHCYY